MIGLWGSVENIPLTYHEDVRSHDLHRSILAELRIVSNQYTLQPLLPMRGSCHSNIDDYE